MNEQENTTAQNGNAQNGNGASTIAPYSLSRPVQFNFKKVKEADFFDGPEDPKRNDADFMGKFETIKDDKGIYYKRKSEVHTLTLPSFLADLDPAIRPAIDSMVENALQLYCKITYVDNFEPVGDHSIETYAAWLASKGGRASAASFDYDKDTLEAAAKSIGRYVGEATGNSYAGEKFEAVALQKFSRTSITKNLGSFSTDLVERIAARVDAWAQFIQEAHPELVDDFTPVYSHFVTILDKHASADKVDISKLI